MESKLKLFLCFWLIFITVAAVYFSVNLLQIHGVLKFVLVVAELVVSGILLQKLMGLEGEWGVLLLRDGRGLAYIDRLAKRNPEFWKTFADVGMVLGFGVFALFFVKDKKKQVWRNAGVFLAGMLILLCTSLFVAPHLLSVTSSVIFNIDVGAASAELKEATAGNGLFSAFAFGALVLGGIATTAVLGILMKAVLVLVAVAQAIMGNAAPLMKTPPGATLIIPGINLPLFEGIIALAILLVVHEGAHGVLARVAKIKLRSAGLVLLGIVPAGAFIDPDEKELAKKDDTAQSRVLVAGAAANLFASLIAFGLLLSFVIATEGFREDALRLDEGAKNVTANRSLPTGTLIYAINGQKIANITNLTFANSSEVLLLTEKGEVKVKTDKYGKLSSLTPFDVVYKDGVALIVKSYKDGAAEAAIGTWTFQWKKEYSWLGFAYSTLGLLFVLNFLVGAINLMPIPVFDGHRILQVNLKNKMIVNAITILVVIGFLANFLPWIVK